MINALIEADRVEVISGAPEPVDVPRDDGGSQTIYRCPACEVALFSLYTRPNVRFVRAGTLDRPWEVSPDAHIFTRSKLPWVAIPDGVPAFDVFYDARELCPPESLERIRAQNA